MSTGASCIVEQFGLAMMPGWPSRSSGLTCETTNGMVGSIRHADELSMTVAPCATAAGASCTEMSAPAEKRAMSTPANASGPASAISSVRPSIETVRPAERPEARRRSSPTGNSRSLRIWIIVRPTTPVAPTTATVRGRGFMVGAAPLILSQGRARPEYSSGPLPPGRRALRSARSAPTDRPWIEGVPEAIADEVDGQDRQRDRDAGGDPEPGRVDEHRRRLCGIDHLAPRRDGDLDAEPEERQAGLEDDRARDAERGEDRERAHDVRDQVTEQDLGRAHADHPRGHDVFRFAKAQHLAA